MGFFSYCGDKFQKIYKNSRRICLCLVSMFKGSITDSVQLLQSKHVSLNALSSPHLVSYTTICAAITYIAFISGTINSHFGLVMGGMLGALNAIRRMQLQEGMPLIYTKFLL